MTPLAEIRARHDDFTERYSPGPDWEPFNQTHQDRRYLLARVEALEGARRNIIAARESAENARHSGDETWAAGYIQALLEAEVELDRALQPPAKDA